MPQRRVPPQSMMARAISSSGHLVLKPFTGIMPVSSTIFARHSGSAPPPVMYITLFFCPVGVTVSGPPNPPGPRSIRMER